jgi:hypothetical protein
MDFWDYHGILFLLGCAFFPRITTLLFSSVSFGLWHILGWIFAPHLLVAILATTYYWDTNPMLVIIAWFFAFGGTGGEVKVAKKGMQRKS